MALDHLSQLVVDRLGQTGAGCRLEMLDPWRGQAEHLDVDSGRIHLPDPTFTDSEQLAEKGILQRLAYVFRVVQPSAPGPPIEQVARRRSALLHRPDVGGDDKMGL